MNTVDFTLKAESVSKKYYIFEEKKIWKLVFNRNAKTIDALQNISITVPKGEFVGILGKNGSGKSTFLRVVGGVYSLSHGIVQLKDNLSAIYELGIHGNHYLTGRQFAKRWLEFYNQCTGKKQQKYIEEIHSFSELNDFFDKPIFQYSTGMKSRLFFSVATAIPGRIYLIDEVLSVGDEYFQAKCWRRLREFFCKGASGILVTHDWTAVIKLCHSAYIFNEGKIEDYGTSPKVIQKYLDVKPPIAKGLNFHSSTPVKFFGNTNENLNITISIEVQRTVKVYFSYSIEVFEIAIGWECLLMIDNTSMGVMESGLHEIHLTIPELPLDSGEYSLNLFLLQTDSDNEASSLMLEDARSWLYGNPYTLIVNDGAVKVNAVKLPITMAS